MTLASSHIYKLRRAIFRPSCYLRRRPIIAIIGLGDRIGDEARGEETEAYK